MAKTARKLIDLGIVEVMKGGSVRIPLPFRMDSGIVHHSKLYCFWDVDEKIVLFSVEKKRKIVLAVER